MQQVGECKSLEGVGCGKYAVMIPWLVCFSASLFFFYEFIQGNMFASIADNIMHDFHIQADKMTYLSSIYYLSNVIFLFVAGFLLDKFSTKKTLLVAMFLCVISTFILAQAQSFYLALACRFMTGIGSAFCFLGPIRIASRWFSPKRMAFVTGAVVTMAMTGGMLAQYPLTKLVTVLGWRESVQIVGWLGVVMWLVMACWIEDRPRYADHTVLDQANDGLSGSDAPGLLARAKQAYLNPQTWRAAFYTSLMNMAVAVFGAMMGSLYLMQRLNISKEDASFINSMLFLGAIVGGPLIGWCSDQLRLRVLPMKLGALLSLVVVLCVLYWPIPMGSIHLMAVLFFLLGCCTAAQVISYALVAESSPPTMIATSVSMVSILTQGGYLVYQNLFSTLLLWHRQAEIVDGIPVYSLDSYQTAALILPVGLLMALWVLFKLKETHCRPLSHNP